MGAEPKKPSVNFQLKTYEARLCLLHFTTLTHTGKLEPLEKKGNQLPYALSLNIQVIAINGGCFSTLEFVGT